MFLNNGPIPYTHHIQAEEIPEVIQKRLGISSNSVKTIHFERGVMNKTVLRPNHWWKITNTNSGLFIYAIPTIEDPQKIDSSL